VHPLAIVASLQLLLAVIQTFFFGAEISIRIKKNPQKLNVFFLDQNRRNYRLYGIWIPTVPLFSPTFFFIRIKQASTSCKDLKSKSLTTKLLNSEFLVVKLKSSLVKAHSLLVPELPPSMNYHQMFNLGNTTDATSGAGTNYPPIRH